MEQLINYSAEISTHQYVADGALYAFSIYPEMYAEEGSGGPELEETGNKMVIAITPTEGTVILTVQKTNGTWYPMEVYQRKYLVLLNKINEVLMGKSASKMN